MKKVKLDKCIIRKKAISILQSLKVTHPPIILNSVIQYLKQIGFSFYIEPRKFSNTLSGLYVRSKQTVGILYNETHPEVRQRFTIAHELGHLLLDHKFNIQEHKELINHNSKDLIEIEANQFAAELLMPFSLVKNETIESEIELERIAKKYWVSKTALFWRMAKHDTLLGLDFDYIARNSQKSVIEEQNSDDVDRTDDYEDLFPPKENYEDSYETAYEYYSDLHIGDLQGLISWIKKFEKEDEYPETYRAIKELIREYSE